MAQVPASTHGVELETTTGLDHRKLMMWAFLGSECLFFGTLISTYLVYRNQSIIGPYPNDIIDVPVTSVSTFVLLMSSFMMVMTLNAIRKGDQRAFRVWILGTAFMGATFLGFQVFEFYEFAIEEHEFTKCFAEGCIEGTWSGLTPWTNLFGSTFFVMVGFHGAHVTVGVIWLVSLFGQSLQGNLKQKDALRVELLGLYWHFVDIVWIVIFTLVYLIGGNDAPTDVQAYLDQGFTLMPLIGN